MLDRKQPITLYKALDEINRLTQISERQSKNLAQALLEKNKLLAEVERLKNFNGSRTEFRYIADDKMIDELKRTKADLKVAQEHYKEIRNAGRRFFDLLGV